MTSLRGIPHLNVIFFWSLQLLTSVVNDSICPKTIRCKWLGKVLTSQVSLTSHDKNIYLGACIIAIDHNNTRQDTCSDTVISV